MLTVTREWLQLISILSQFMEEETVFVGVVVDKYVHDQEEVGGISWDKI